MRLLAALIVWAGCTGVSSAAPKIAVLEASGPADTPRAIAMGWTDAVRDAVVGAAPANWVVLTRDNIEAFLPPGVDLADCDGECEISTGRSIGAEYVVTTRLTGVEQGWRITVAVHATVNGRFVGQHRLVTPMDALEAGLARAAIEAMRSLAPTPAASGASVVVRQGQPLKWYGAPVLKVTSPHGAIIHAFGRKQGRTPVRIPLRGARRVRLRAEAAGYRPRIFEVELGPRSNQIEVQLERVAANLHLEVPLAGVRVAVDGKGLVHRKTLLISAGHHVVEVTHPCLKTQRFVIDAAPGDEIRRTVAPEFTCGRLRFEASADNATIRWRGRMRRLPFVTQPLPAQAHTVLVTATGHRAAKQTVHVPPQGERLIRFELVPIWSRVTVRAERWDARPCKGTLAIDGKTVGELPWSGRVLAGHRRLSATCTPATRKPLRRGLNFEAGERTVVLEEPAAQAEFLVRVDGARMGQLNLRGWSAGRRPGRVRAGFGLWFGTMIGDDQVLPAFGFDVSGAVGVTRWLELGVGASVGGGPEDCASDPDENDCSFGYTSAQAHLRGFFGATIVELGWAAVGDSSRHTKDGRNHGPHIAVGATF